MPWVYSSMTFSALALLFLLKSLMPSNHISPINPERSNASRFNRMSELGPSKTALVSTVFFRSSDLLVTFSQLHLLLNHFAQQGPKSVLANHVEEGLTFFLFNSVDCSSQCCRKILGIFYAFAVSATGLDHLFKHRRRTQVGQ